MKVRSRKLAYLAAAVFALGLVVVLTGCSSFDSPQNTFAPGGDVAERQRDLFFLVMWPALVIGLLVAGVLTYSLLRYRRRGEDEPPPKQVHGNQGLELAWTIAPALLLIGLAVPTIDAIVDLGRDPAEGALPVTVKAFQWGWQFEYPEFTDAEGKPISANEMHIPVDREIAVRLESQDVIHSFWVPKLGGKLDVVPGRENRMWLNATSPGTYDGQCAEFCGLGHAVMRFEVVAESDQDFQAWVDEQLASESTARNAAPSGSE